MKPTVIFDLGGVLIDWNPRYLYRTVFEEENQMEFFLGHIATPEWNELQDAGRTLEEATLILSNHFPEYKREIQLYYSEWTSMLNGAISQTVDILKSLKEKEYRILALTNWSAETFPTALDLFEFLHWFEGIVVSGIEKMKKPDPAIFNLLIKRYSLTPSDSIYIDDHLKNIETANRLGFNTIYFTSPQDLLLKLKERGVEL